MTRGRGVGGDGASSPPHPQPLSPEYRGIGIYTSAEKAELEHLLWLRKSAKCLFTLFLIHASDPKTTCVDTNAPEYRGEGSLWDRRSAFAIPGRLRVLAGYQVFDAPAFVESPVGGHKKPDRLPREMLAHGGAQRFASEIHTA